MRTKLFAVALAIVAVTAAFGASAYTTGTVDRTASVNVVSDNSGLIGLSDGTTGDIVKTNGTGALTIDFTRNGATGVNSAANFEIGDTVSANTTAAFNITNNDGESHDFTLSYAQSVTDSDADANIQFKVYDANNNLLGTTSENSAAPAFTVAAGATVHVVIVVDTHGLTSTDDLSGTLTVAV